MLLVLSREERVRPSAAYIDARSVSSGLAVFIGDG